MRHPDKTIMEKISSGDQGAFQILSEKYEPFIRYKIFSMLKEKSAAEVVPLLAILIHIWGFLFGWETRVPGVVTGVFLVFPSTIVVLGGAFSYQYLSTRTLILFCLFVPPSLIVFVAVTLYALSLYGILF